MQSANVIHTHTHKHSNRRIDSYIYAYSQLITSTSLYLFLTLLLRLFAKIAACLRFVLFISISIGFVSLSLFLSLLLSTCRFYIFKNRIYYIIHILCLCRRLNFSDLRFFCHSFINSFLLSEIVLCPILNALLKNCYSDKTISSELTSEHQYQRNVKDDEKTKVEWITVMNIFSECWRVDLYTFVISNHLLVKMNGKYALCHKICCARLECGPRGVVLLVSLIHSKGLDVR